MKRENINVSLVSNVIKMLMLMYVYTQIMEKIKLLLLLLLLLLLMMLLTGFNMADVGRSDFVCSFCLLLNRFPKAQQFCQPTRPSYKMEILNVQI